MLYFILFTALAALGLFFEEWLPLALVLSAFLGLLLLLVKTLMPQGILSVHRFTVTVKNLVRYNVVRWIVAPCAALLLFLGYFFGARYEDFRITLLLFYLLEIGFFCVYPLLRWLVPKTVGYLQIKKVCREHGYCMTGSFFRFLFPDDTTPALTIETPAEIFSVQVLGTSGEPQKYSFGRGQTYTVQKIQRYAANYVDELEREGDCTALRWIKALYYGKEKEKTLAAPLEGVTNILLFAPDFAYCKAEGKDTPVEVGNMMHGYSVYNVRRFVRGRLAAAHTSWNMPETAETM